MHLLDKVSLFDSIRRVVSAANQGVSPPQSRVSIGGGGF